MISGEQVSLRKLAISIRTRLDSVPRAEFMLVAVLSALIACLTGLWVAYRIGYFDGQVSCGYPCTGSGHSEISIYAMRLRIAIGLGAATIGICLKRSLGFFLSLLSLTLVELEYIRWYFRSTRWLREVGLVDFSRLPSQTEIPHALGLYGAMRWDILVLGIATALFFWELRVLVGALRSLNAIPGKDSRQV
jgi:hypothetical protein